MDGLKKLKELHDLCLPLVEYMRKNFTPHDCLVITDSNAKILKGDMFVLVPYDFDKESQKFGASNFDDYVKMAGD